MFEDITVVPSAISAFNNAALAAPAFLWNALLCLPIFIGAFLFGRAFNEKLGLKNYISMSRVSFWTVVMGALWLVLMGGNYDVLRDGVSVLPWLSAAILFVACLFIGFKTKSVALPVWRGASDASNRKKWLMNVFVATLFLVPVALSDTLNWWGPILQVFAVLSGLFVGRRWLRRDAPMFFLLVCVLMVTTAVLMQPEYFRFGQLGNLTPWHLLWVLITGIVTAMVTALVFVNPRSKVRHSAFIKIKWLLRFISVLCAVLFVLTEAVPVFLATVLMVFLLVALSIWHAEKMDANICEFFASVLVILFGVLISVPTISVLGVLQLAILSSNDQISYIKKLL